MLRIIETNKQILLNSSNTYKYDNDIYGILLKTGKYIYAKEISYSKIRVLFWIKII